MIEESGYMLNLVGYDAFSFSLAPWLDDFALSAVKCCENAFVICAGTVNAVFHLLHLHFLILALLHSIR